MLLGPGAPAQQPSACAVGGSDRPLTLERLVVGGSRAPSERLELEGSGGGSRLPSACRDDPLACRGVSYRFISLVRVIVIAGLAVVALAGCASSFGHVAGSDVPASSTNPLGRGVIDRAPLPHLRCIRAAGLPAVAVGLTGIQVGVLPAGPTIEFAPDPNTAEGEQIRAEAPGAEVIGAALLYVHGAPDAELKKLEGCLDEGVAG